MASFHTWNDEYARHVWIDIAVLRSCVCVRANRVERWLYSSAGIWKNEVALLPARPFVRFALSFGKQNARLNHEGDQWAGREEREGVRERESRHHPTPPSQPLDPTYFNSFPLLRLNNLRLFRARIYTHSFLKCLSQYMYIDKIWTLINVKLLYMIYSFLIDVLLH